MFYLFSLYFFIPKNKRKPIKNVKKINNTQDTYQLELPGVVSKLFDALLTDANK